jgi:hypothetical protein
MIDRIVDELQMMPPVPADATARVLARVDAARRGSHTSDAPDDDDVIFFPTNTEEMRAAASAPAQPVRPAAAGQGGQLRRRFVVSLPAALGYALAATVAGFLIRGALPTRDAPSSQSVSGPVTSPLGARPAVIPAAVSTRDLQEAPLKVQFVLDAPSAKRVAVVGDFNAWDASRAPLERDSASGIWSTLVDVRPGRHVYAFLVDGKVWTLDPNAPRTKDPDYGTEQSVRIVRLP